MDPQVRDPNRLCPCIRSKYLDLREDCHLSGIPVTLVETIRTPARQAHYLAIGVSRTAHSLHLAQPPHGLALAFDLAPTEYLNPRVHRDWCPGGELWQRLGEMGERLGLEWGGRWSTLVDLPHYQLRACQCTAGADPGISAPSEANPKDSAERANSAPPSQEPDE